MPSEGYELTPEQLARQEARKLKRQKKKEELANSAPPAQTEDNGAIVFRPWLTVQAPSSDNVEIIKLMTWNLLAQCLVRPEKLHGCLIAYRNDAFEKADATVIQYDDVNVRSEGSDSAQKGLSFRTRNIASIVGLKRKGSDDDGVVVATTHLFWHPSYSYERARQAGLLMRETIRFRDTSGHPNWPCVLTGDFNFTPIDPGYSLLVGDQLLPAQEDRLARSRVVHASVDPSVPVTGPKAEEEDEASENDAEMDSDHVLTNARNAEAADGLLSTSELLDLYATPSRPRSAYDLGQRIMAKKDAASIRRCGERYKMPDARLGAFEPEWTSYTHFWKTVLDYIFIIDPPHRVSSVTRLLQSHKTDDMHPGLPRKGVSGSDHISLAAEIQWHNV
ncbi:hypothetical protein EWM64_g4971 [Hericium alpestre]|uniref:Endonuclease/exonuclease/phosphatase domain-containing protein n=1 Tax=Hericium alpestre TaxID=135208 RepID=A0A4Y9ZXX0_9AGAM|nr:hypothetical protein EWM64_g4971 [Hericium alpestre]